MLKQSCLNESVYDLSKVSKICLLILISICMFLVPIVVPNALTQVFGAESAIASNSQIVVGVIVNTALVMSAISIKGWKNIVALVTVPSISALTSGLVLNVASVFTLYMIPAIWLGNLAIIYAIKRLYVKHNMNYILASAIGVASKGLIIFGGFSLLNIVIAIPEKIATILGTAMGVNQVITATIGCAIAYILTKEMFQKDK